MSKPLKEDYIIRIKSRIEQRLDEPAAEEEKEEFVELMTRGSFVLKGGSAAFSYLLDADDARIVSRNTLEMTVDRKSVV